MFKKRKCEMIPPIGSLQRKHNSIIETKIQGSRKKKEQCKCRACVFPRQMMANKLKSY